MNSMVSTVDVLNSKIGSEYECLASQRRVFENLEDSLPRAVVGFSGD